MKARGSDADFQVKKSPAGSALEKSGDLEERIRRGPASILSLRFRRFFDIIPVFRSFGEKIVLWNPFEEPEPIFCDGEMTQE